jgi:hypothetical protein
MPYQIRVGSMTAVVADEREALQMLRRLAGSVDEKALITDIFGSEVDVATLESRAVRETRNELWFS